MAQLPSVPENAATAPSQPLVPGHSTHQPIDMNGDQQQQQQQQQQPQPLQPQQPQQQQQQQQQHNDQAPHACPECNARFTRLEHLKRHITSLHHGHSPKPHGCQSCGKRFSRRDVLLRHHQSCRAVKANSLVAEQNQRRTKRACQTCNHLQLKCSGGPRCEKCAELGQDCTYDPRRRRTNSTHHATSPVQLPAVNPSEPLIGGNPNPSLAPSYLSPSHIDPALTREGDGDIFLAGEIDPKLQAGNVFQGGQQNGDNTHQEDWTFQQPQGVDASGLHDFTRRMSEGDSTRSAAGGSSQKKPTNKRGRYVSNACMNCQKRKVKCSGEETCLQCRSTGLVCLYNYGRKRRNTVGSKEERPKPAPVNAPVTALPTAGPQDQTRLSDSLLHMMARIASLERDCDMFKNHVVIKSQDHDMNSVSESNFAHGHGGGYQAHSDINGSSSTGGFDGEGSIFQPIEAMNSGDEDLSSDETSSECGSSVTSLTESEVVHGASSLLPAMDLLNRTVACDEEERNCSSTESPVSQAASSITWNKLSRGGNKDLKTLERDTRSNDVTELRHSVDVFFSYLNPHYPCLNENQFRAQLESYLANDSRQNSNADRYQFMALLNLIQAEVKILSHQSNGSNRVPGWKEFCRAEKIMNYFIWLGNGNMLTIQCLVIKARYLLYIEKADSAYDTIGRVVRLCFQLGLHDQPSWKDLSAYETVMRQRIFWTVFYLERNIAFNCGSPYLIRESDFQVDLPGSYDDMCMFPNEPLPQETPERSYGPYLVGAAKWGKLCSEIWDAIFGIQKRSNQEFAASMDARVVYTLGQLPAHLQWQRNMHRLDGTADVPPFVLRQSIILHLRMNQLRLLLRQECMLGLKYNDTNAAECVAIAASSVNAIHTFNASPLHQPTDRFSSLLYLVGAIIPLICVIVRRDNVAQTRTDAIEAFKRNLEMMEEMSPNFTQAGHALGRLQWIVGTAKRTFELVISADHPVADVRDIHTDALAPPAGDFFNYDHWMDLDKDIFNPQHSGALTYNLNLNHVMDPNVFHGTTDEMDALWLDDSAGDRRLLMPNMNV
ncbi:MAG: hypothetical protein M1818_002990 [Claussenomyces sp. TS43310]|nr:MAG: hypothetical protein M1818_002990 [Claussenomyces sp. TS43310]